MCLEGAYAADGNEPESQVTTEETIDECEEPSDEETLRVEPSDAEAAQDASEEEVQEEAEASDAAEAAPEEEAVTEEVPEEETQEEAAVPALAYLVVNQPELSTPDTQQIVVGIGSEEVVLDAATITVYNESTGVSLDYAASSLTGGAALFEIAYSDGQAGAYTLSSVCYTYEGVETRLDLAEIGISARYGVDTEVETDPDDVLVSEDEDADVELEISTINEAGELEQVDSIEEALTIADAETSDMGIMALGLDDDDDENGAFGIMALGLDDEEGISTFSLRSTAQSGNIVVVLDAGHDSTHAGAAGNGLHEEVLNLKIAQYCQAELEEYAGVTVYMTRSTSDCPFPGTSAADDNSNRVKYAASVDADYYVAIHLNSSSSGIRGAEVYYPNENYATSDTNSAVNSGVNLNQSGVDLAQSIMDQLVGLGLPDHGLRIRNSEDNTKYSDGSLADYYAVIRGSKRNGICGLIIEHCYITNSTDAKNYLSSEYDLKRLGVADATGIANYLGLTKGPNLEVATISDGVYEICTSVNSGYALDIAGGSTANNANAQAHNRNNTMAQQFQVTSVGGGYYKIINVKSGMALDVAGESKAAGANVWQHTWNGSDAQLWRFLDAEDGTYYLQSKLGTVLSLASATVSSGTNVQTGKINYETTQRWSLVSTSLRSVTIADGVYEICTSVNSGYALDIAGGSTANNANAQAHNRNNTMAQQFEITSVGDGYYKIVNVKSGMALDVAGGSAASGANVWQHNLNGSNAQLWKFLDAGDGTYYLQSKLGTVLSLASTTVSSGTNVQTENPSYVTSQRWSLVRVLSAATIADGVYEICTNVNSGYALDIAGGSTANNANAQAHNRNNTMAQQFQITSVGGGYYKIINVKSGMALDVSGGSAASGANVWQHNLNGSDAQLWRFLDAEDGTYYLQSKLGTVLSLASATVSSGTNVQTGTLSYAAAQRWTLVSAPLNSVTITDGIYEICTSVNSGYALDIAGGSTANNANAQAHNRNHTEAQQFEITSVGDGYYKIVNVKSGMALDVAGGSAASGANVWQHNLNGSNAQLWKFLDAGDGTYYLQSKLGTVLSLASTTVSSGTNVQTGEITYGTAQRWSLKIALTEKPATINENSEAIWDYLVNEAGLTPAGAAGLMGNLDAESGLNPQNLENRFEKLLYYTVTIETDETDETDETIPGEAGETNPDETAEVEKIYYTDETYTEAVDNGTYRYGDYDNAGESFAHDYVGSTSGKLGAGYGIAQWTWYSYKLALYDYAKSKGTSVGDLQTQLEFLVDQLKTEFPTKVWKVLTTTDDVMEASNAVLLNFEKPADQSLTVQYKRAGKGLTYYNTYA
jgi:N-acetylmuramoyl-L-alanine amidase